MKPDFDMMSKAELRAYIVAHTDDQEAFYKFVDRFAADTDRVWHSFSNTPEEVAKMGELIQEQIKMLENHNNDKQDK